jgi:hypothetical protein
LVLELDSKDEGSHHRRRGEGRKADPQRLGFDGLAGSMLSLRDAPSRCCGGSQVLFSQAGS